MSRDGKVSGTVDYVYQFLSFFKNYLLYLVNTAFPHWHLGLIVVLIASGMVSNVCHYVLRPVEVGESRPADSEDE